MSKRRSNEARTNVLYFGDVGESVCAVSVLPSYLLQEIFVAADHVTYERSLLISLLLGMSPLLSVHKTSLSQHKQQWKVRTHLDNPTLLCSPVTLIRTWDTLEKRKEKRTGDASSRPGRNEALSPDGKARDLLHHKKEKIIQTFYAHCRI